MRPQLISKGTINRLLNAADEARSRGDFKGVVEALERASRLDPANITLLLHLGHACGTYFDFAAAERAFDRAIRISPNKAEIFSKVGMRARSFGNNAMAENYFRRALEQKDVSAETITALAEISERQSRIEEATELANRAVRLKPNFPAALLVQARLKRQAGKFEEAEKILLSFPAEASRELQARAHYERGNVLDRLGRYDDAMAAFVSAKALLAPDAAPHIAGARQVRSQLNELRNALNPEILKRWHNSKNELQPLHRLALLCGHPRSGTTLLEQVLDSHRDIVSGEETNIFHNNAYPPLTRNAPMEATVLSVLESASTNTLNEARADYFRMMERFLGNPIGVRLLIDKNPILTFLIAPFVRIFPEAKLLVALRDPRDVCLSCFMQPLPLNQSGAAYLTMEGTVNDYVALMGMYQTLSPQLLNEHLEVRYEDMVEDLKSVSRRALDFLGVEWDERVLRFDEHARQKLVRSPTYADVTKPVFKRAVGRWHHYQKYLEPHLDKLAPFARAFGYEA
jgi:tetratricopeptide (TPR) repeat protein